MKTLERGLDVVPFPSEGNNACTCVLDQLYLEMDGCNGLLEDDNGGSLKEILCICQSWIVVNIIERCNCPNSIL